MGAWESEPGDSTPATRGVGAREEPRGHQQSTPGPTLLAGTVPSLEPGAQTRLHPPPQGKLAGDQALRL